MSELRFKDLLIRLRFIPVLLAFTLFIYFLSSIAQGVPIEEAYIWSTRFDYLFWAITLLTCLSVYLDVKVFWKQYSYASTYLISLVAGLAILVSRVILLLANVFYNAPFSLRPLIGPIYAVELAIMSFGIITVSAPLALIVILFHSIVGRPIIWFEAEPLDVWFNRFMRRLESQWTIFWSRDVSYLATAFLFGFAFRLIPEVLWWPWHIGWDTVEYTAHLMDFSERLNPFTSYYWMGGMRNIPPLLNILLLPLTYTVGAWNAFKIYPPLAFGLLTLSSALFARKVLKLGRIESFLVSLVTALYILNLRISWDYQRQLLGSIFMILALIALETWNARSFRMAVISGALLLCCALSHEVTAFFALSVSAALIYSALRERDPGKLSTGVIGLMVSATLEAWYWQRPYTHNIYLGAAPIGVVSTSYDNTAPEVVGYLTAGYGLTLPLALIALSRMSRELRYTRVGLIALLIAGLSPLIAPHTSAATWYRFLIGLAPIASTLAGAGLLLVTRDKRCTLTYLLLISLTGFGFAYSVDLAGRFTASLREFPSALIPSPATQQLLNDLRDLARWFEENNINSTVICEPWTCRWVHLGMRNPTPNSLLWMWQTPISSPSIKQVLESRGLDEAYVICSFCLQEVEGMEIHELRGGYLQVYLVKIVKDDE